MSTLLNAEELQLIPSYDEEKTEDIEDTEDVIDDASSDSSVIPGKYDITSYGADFDVDGLVRRIQREDVFIPTFQRDYVWNQQEASRFIESLLLGLPVPGVFMAKERSSNRLLVIDGQQRLRSLQFFIEGFFNPRKDETTKRVFKLIRVQPKFEGRTYQTLEDSDRITFRDAIIHATVVKQESPSDDDTSVYHIFERLNNGGRKLTAEEIRSAIYHGKLISLIKGLNEHDQWRSIFGQRNNRLKDEELILRFLALYFNAENYVRPMSEFLNKFAQKNQNLPDLLQAEARNAFVQSIDTMWEVLGNKAFRPERPLNAAVFDSVMVGLARRLIKGPIDIEAVKSAYFELLKSDNYIKAISQATSNKESVVLRLDEATKAFAGIKP